MELAPNGGIITFNTLPPALIDPIQPTVTLSASAASIEPGEATTLTWSSTNGDSATITPDIGEVDPSGSARRVATGDDHVPNHGHDGGITNGDSIGHRHGERVGAGRADGFL